MSFSHCLKASRRLGGTSFAKAGCGGGTALVVPCKTLNGVNTLSGLKKTGITGFLV